MIYSVAEQSCETYTQSENQNIKKTISSFKISLQLLKVNSSVV